MSLIEQSNEPSSGYTKYLSCWQPRAIDNWEDPTILCDGNLAFWLAQPRPSGTIGGKSRYLASTACSLCLPNDLCLRPVQLSDNSGSG